MGNQLLAAVWGCTLVVALLAAPARADVIVGLTTTNELVVFDSATPGTILGTVAITGLQASENALAIDFESTGQLLALGSTNRLYAVNLATGVATQLGSGPFTPPLGSNFVGLEVIPTSGFLRVVAATDENLRVGNEGEGVLANETPLAYAVGDVNFGVNPNVVAIAHTNNNLPATFSTTLYAIDSGLDTLARLGGPEGTPPPSGGQLFTIGPLGVDTSGLAGFDIDPRTGGAFAALTVGGVSQLRRINLGNGTAVLLGAIGSGLAIRDIAVVAFQRILVTGAGAGGGPHVQVFDAVTRTLKFSFFAFDPGFTGGVRVVGCDVNGDGIPDVVAGAGPGGGPHVRVFNGLTGAQLPGLIGSFFAFDPSFAGGVFVGCVDLNGDGRGDVIVGAGPGGGPHVRVFSGASGAEITGALGSFFPYSPAFPGGVFVGGGP